MSKYYLVQFNYIENKYYDVKISGFSIFTETEYNTFMDAVSVTPIYYIGGIHYMVKNLSKTLTSTVITREEYDNFGRLFPDLSYRKYFGVFPYSLLNEEDEEVEE